ncbi:peptide/nickel transport system substrate-binding protein [Branchiibius hedensis]|uniref:Peptide/nickel transport system substrate-binding protein n=1 Tax=Branchiibius hedensis TaxID=672460 RepID=A0A2Y8ZKL6_9MICO|nr:ABC transporter substrate-binding protein [Branchiibius hedensis]PWJ24122.1 peptide/nickel transport system substrate-binding protein [Branchiibius hedensis]SSA32940.1 peptide/nickel transport system substrate-binding protein [Branchiibius hedensis]
MRKILLAAVAAGAVALAGCSSGGGVNLNGSASGSAGGGSAAANAGGALTAAISAEPDQLDPNKTSSYASFEVLENVYDTLVEPDAKGEMQPDLATSWKTSSDQLTWTFTMRDGVKFSDGTPLNAKNVVYTYDRIIKGKLSPSWRFASVSSVTAPDDKTVEIKVKTPTPNLLTLIGGFKGVGIVEEKNVTSGKIGRDPIGSGPFVVSDWVSGDHITLKPNANYWGDKPKLSSVTYRFISDGNTAITALKNGEIQWTDVIPPQQVKGLESNSAVKTAVVPSNDYQYLTMNQKKAPFNNVAVRQAIAWAIDRQAIVQATTYGTGTENQLAIPKQSQWYTEYDKYSKDENKAKQLFAQAGHKGGTINFLATSDYPETVTTAQIIASALQPYGINVKIKTVDFATFLSDQGAGNWDMYMMSWIGNIDPAEYYFSQQRTGQSFNFQHYSNAEVDKLLDAGAIETDQAKRKEDYAKAATIVADEASYIYLYNPAVIQAWSPKLTGYEARSDKAIRFGSASISQ